MFSWSDGEATPCVKGAGALVACRNNWGAKQCEGSKRMNKGAVTGQDIKDSGLLCNSRKSVRGYGTLANKPGGLIKNGALTVRSAQLER